MKDHGAMTIALLTDFGTRDPYVAAMKGVIVSRTGAAIHDLSHDIAPFDAWAAAFFLRDAERYWPAGTVFCCVVDPGVGTARRIVAVESGGRSFLAPDNGLLTFVDGAAYEVTRESLFLPDGSATFHGRDRFAPVAAALANGLRLDELGPPADDRLRLAYEGARYACDRVEGTIVAIDRFGNCITDIEVARIVFPRFAVRAGTQTIARTSRTYAEAGPGPFLIAGSAGSIELSVAGGSAAELLQLRRGDCVTLIPH